MIAHLVASYVALGHQVSVISTGADLARPECRSGPTGVTLTVVPARTRARNKALDFFRAERAAISAALTESAPDVVHAHWTYEFAMGARQSGLPRLVTVHDWAPAVLAEMRDPYRVARLAMQVDVLRREGHLTAPTHYLADRVERWFRVPCPVVANGIPLNAFSSPRVREWSKTGPVVGLLSASDSRLKNVRRALECWPAVRRRHPTAELRVGGPSFGVDSPCARWAAERGLGDGVRFQGTIRPDAVPGWMAELDVFLHPSLEESFGLVLVEAMAAGAVVVAGRHSGAVPEVVGDAGILVDVSSAEDLTAAILRVLADRGTASELARRGIVRSRSYSIGTVAEQYLGLLDAVAGAPTSG